MRWLRKNWKQSILIAVVAYATHLLVETFIVTNILAAFGLKIPVFLA